MGPLHIYLQLYISSGVKGCLNLLLIQGDAEVPKVSETSPQAEHDIVLIISEEQE